MGAPCALGWAGIQTVSPASPQSQRADWPPLTLFPTSCPPADCTECSHVDERGRLRENATGFQNEGFIKHIADTLNASGLQALGYTAVNMDSLWNLPTRDAAGDLVPDPALWPSGFPYIVKYVHQLGLGFGVYGDRGTLDCNRNPGQLGHETADANFFARMELDWFKSDSCYASPDPDTAFQEYATMRDALNKTGRAIWFALCGWESYYAWKPPGEGKSLGNSWRVNMDTGGGWGPIMANVNAMLYGGPNGTSLAPYGRPGGWNDMCLLLNPGMGSGASLMTPERSRSQFGLHCIFNANMLLTGNLSALLPSTLAVWGNAEAVAINQDTAHTFLQLPLEPPPAGQQPALPAPAALAPARLAECGGEPSAQNWTWDAPAPGFLTNAASRQCLNVEACGSTIVYDGCSTTGGTCAGPDKYSNEQWALDASSGALVSALPGGHCAAANADNTLALSPDCTPPLPPAKVWRYTAATGELVNSNGLCLTVSAPAPPPSLASLLVGRQLQDGSWALLALNNGNASATLVCGAACLGAMGFIPGQALAVRDVWARADLPPTTAVRLAMPTAAAGGSAFWRVSRA